MLFPEILILIMACVTLLAGLYTQGKLRECLVYSLVQLGLISAFFITLKLLLSSDIESKILYDMLIIDKLACVLKLGIYIISMCVFAYGREYIQERGISVGEYYTLGLFSILGMMVLVSSNNLLPLFLALELLSLPLYALVAVLRDLPVCTEAAIKYFVMGALATGILLYGFSMLYGITASLDFTDIGFALGNLPVEKNILALFSLAFVLVGLAFKLGLAPFHMWVPDVYEGAPTSVTLFIATAPKLAIFGILIRLLTAAMPSLSLHWQELLILLSIASIVIGNLIAILQTNIRRLLAYSSIAHMGYMVLGIIAVTSIGYAASMFYIFTYVLSSLAIFGFVLIMGTAQPELQAIQTLRGLNHRNPWLAFMALIILFSMAGIPPIVGFMAKLSVLEALINTHLISLAIFTMLFAIVGVYYYVKVIKEMYFEAPENISPILYSKTQGGLLTLNCLVILGLGVFPAALFQLCQSVFV